MLVHRRGADAAQKASGWRYRTFLPFIPVVVFINQRLHAINIMAGTFDRAARFPTRQATAFGLAYVR
jgi:hypothetical protein